MYLHYYIWHKGLVLDSFIHSFIHIEHLYSAPSRKLLRGAPDSSTAKKNSFKVSKERGREGPRNKAKLQSEAIPGRGTPTEKARFCIVEVRAKGTSRSPCSDERRDREPLALMTGQQSSRR